MNKKQKEILFKELIEYQNHKKRVKREKIQDYIHNSLILFLAFLTILIFPIMILYKINVFLSGICIGVGITIYTIIMIKIYVEVFKNEK